MLAAEFLLFYAGVVPPLWYCTGKTATNPSLSGFLYHLHIIQHMSLRRPRPRGICTHWKRMPVGLMIINNNNQPFWFGDTAEADWFYWRKRELCVSSGSPHRSLTCMSFAHMCNQLHVNSSSPYPSLPSCFGMIHSTSIWVPTVSQAQGRVPEKNTLN